MKVKLNQKNHQHLYMSALHTYIMSMKNIERQKLLNRKITYWVWMERLQFLAATLMILGICTFHIVRYSDIPVHIAFEKAAIQESYAAQSRYSPQSVTVVQTQDNSIYRIGSAAFNQNAKTGQITCIQIFRGRIRGRVWAVFAHPSKCLLKTQKLI